MSNLNADNLCHLINGWFKKTVLEDSVLKLNGVDAERIIDIYCTDYRRYYEGDINLRNILCRGELQGILMYRVSRNLYLKGDDFCNETGQLGRILSGFEMYYSAEVGESFKVNHGIGMVIGARSKVGKFALFHHNVTLGDHKDGRPELMDRVTLYPGSMILGNITIGNDVIVGANSVCLQSIPDGKTVAGVPAKII